MASIVKRGKGGNTFAVTYYVTNLDGTKEKKWISGLTEKEAKFKKVEIEAQAASNSIFQPTGKTVKEFLEGFIADTAPLRWKQKTYIMYVSLLKNHVIPYIGGVKLRDLNASHINKLFAMLKDKPTHQNNPYRKAGGALSSTTRMHIFTVLGEALGYAVTAREIASSPMPDPKNKPKRAKVKNAIWTPDLFQMALEDMDNPMLRLGVHFAFMGSCNRCATS